MSLDARLVAVFRRVFRVETVEPESSPDTVPDWDSLAHLALVSDLEREFSVQFSADEVVEMVNVRIIAEILTGRGALADNGAGGARA